MKLAVAFVLAILVADVFARPVLDQNIIRRINEDPETTWTAGVNERFAGMEWEHVLEMMSTRPRLDKPFGVVSHNVDAASLPTSFDARTEWPNCIHPIRDQAQCGSCWAFGATESLSDRFCISSKGATNVVLSPEYLVACDSTDYGCNGGYLDNAWAWMKNKGVPSDACYPYSSGSGSVPSCSNKCHDGSAMHLYKVASVHDLNANQNDIMQEIMTNGPVEAAFDVYQDFFSYKSGVYSHKTGSLAGGHAIKVIGWGVDGSTPYWIVANSWGTSWGMNGFFWIKRGTNECGIEGNVVCGTPDLSSAASKRPIRIH